MQMNSVPLLLLIVLTIFLYCLSAIAKKFVSARDTSFLSINKKAQTAGEQSLTMVRKYEAP